MLLTLVPRLAGVLGGLLLVIRHLGGVDQLRWPGLVLLTVALAGGGAALVSSSAGWLRVIVAVAFPALVWSVVEVLHDSGGDSLVDALVGAVVALACVVALVRPGRARHHAGSHAA
ncbi:hypothetical protein NSZ01_38830 [Nocardioides szechwanensis]|uniref:Uncharacterized protein n=1 Tax=Nocardioides szechwanensis TaxID=1005944 RepID=A0A1H0BIT2_9ACTN|nr:hypothetical protein [Nocardioides szechwanensis]GEP36115.1 hypothetical protein NSZ01_38830 [Nocardioides szechwanensis]SDN45568.1 hypothetical protein SAMN05192576_2150 [Nocardioides szechwanensis]